MIRTISAAIMLQVTVAVAFAGKEQPSLQAWNDGADMAHAIDIRGVRWTIPAACLPRRDLGSDATVRDLGDKAGERDLGADRAERDLGDAAGTRDLGADGSERDLGDKAGERDLGADAGQRDLGADGSERDLGDRAAERDLGAGAGQRDLGDAAGERDLGTDAGKRDLGSDVETFHCMLDPRQESVIIFGLDKNAVTLPGRSRFDSVSAGPDYKSVRIHL